MEGRLELTGLSGSLRWSREGDYLRLRAWAQGGSDGLYKLYLGGGGGVLEIGTLMPEGSALVLERRLCAARLEQAGCWPILWGEARRVFSFTKEKAWRPAEGLAERIEDPVLHRAAAQLRDALLRETDRGWELAVPFRPGREFGLVALFCLGRPMKWEGGQYLRFAFDKNGVPLPPE